MADETWRKENPEVATLEGVAWLEGFYCRLKEDELCAADAEYLKELDQWLKMLKTTHEDGAFDDEDEDM